MTVYVIVIAVVVLGLLAAYRSLGGATMATPDPPVLLARALDEVRRSLDLLAASLAAGQADRRAEPSREGRRAHSAAQQTVDRVPPASDLGESEATARAVLAGAVEDLGWAWRLVAGDGSSPAIIAAASLLRDHATECCAAAEGLLGPRSAAALGEPRDGG